ncbi:hypothetical protein HPB47_001695 [Ixodes persulcatus]|uniref:Uncharacterized protein n=1 Tax=Ixodes persulcatus TaxID=34615 RepID=A0AC60PPF3_IXOPE|nr:hypothetical protein HPB47_001695 [Ixodes persulcatus]
MGARPTWITADDPDKPILMVAAPEEDLPLPARTTEIVNLPAVSLEGGDQNADGMNNPDAAATAASERPSSGPLVVVCAILTALTLSSAMVLYDYVAVELRQGHATGMGILVTTALGDLLARLGTDAFLRTVSDRRLSFAEIPRLSSSQKAQSSSDRFDVCSTTLVRKTATVVQDTTGALTVQCLLNGGILFLMAVFDKGTPLVVLGLAFGWTSGSLITLTVPVLKSNLDASRVQYYAELSRFAAAAALLLGPVLVGVFKDGEGSYSGLLLVSGLFSLIGGFIWLPFIINDSKSSDQVAAEVMPGR